MATKDFPKKVYLNSDQQIEKLRADGLRIPDEEHAKRRLKWEGYYNFAVGYNRLFKDDTHTNQMPGGQQLVGGLVSRPFYPLASPLYLGY